MTAELAIGAETEARASWVPMICIALGQVLMSFNVSSLPVALSGMVASFDVPPTTIATGYAGVVVEGMGAGHVPADAAPILGDIAAKIPVVLASRAMPGPVFTQTYGYPGSEIDLIARHLTPAGYLSGLKARLLLALFLRSGKKPGTAAQAFAPYQ
jgi:L-asparaginase/Glu-tRNA(Gln) amidotransferase subunit D